MAQIFLSYAHQDQAAATRIVDALAREGFDTWWDHDIPPGRTWDEVIGARVAAATVVVVIWSSHSKNSDFVKEEAQLGAESRKLLPVKVEDVDPPIGFRRLHAANLIGWKGEVDHRQWLALVAELRSRLNQPKLEPETLVGSRWRGTYASSAGQTNGYGFELRANGEARNWSEIGGGITEDKFLWSQDGSSLTVTYIRPDGAIGTVWHGAVTRNSFRGTYKNSDTGGGTFIFTRV